MRVLYPPYIPWGKEKKKSFCINTHLLFQFYTQEFEYLSKTLISPKPTTLERFRNERKQKASYEFLSNWQMQQKEGGKDFLMYKRGLTDLTEAFGPFLRNAQSSTETSYTDSAFLTSFLLILPVLPHSSYPLWKISGIERCWRKVYHSPVIHYLSWKSYWKTSQCKKETSSLTTALLSLIQA